MNYSKTLKKIEDASLLFISADEHAHSNLFENIKSSFKSSFLATTSESGLSAVTSSNVDVIVLDANITKSNFRSCCFGIEAQNQHIPKIIIADNVNDEILQDALNFGAFMVLTKSIDWQNLLLVLEMSINSAKCCNKLIFPDGSYYHETKGLFFKKDNTQIDFTKLELGIMQLMIEKRGEIVDYDMIKSVVWSDKEMSVYTMRNIISKIRMKMYHDVIKNYSNKGYSLDTSKVCS